MRLVRAFAGALTGCRTLVTTQPHARIQLAASVAAVRFGLRLRVSRDGWCWWVAATATVWTAEAPNTAIESLADRVTTERNPHIGRANGRAAARTASAGATGLRLGSS